MPCRKEDAVASRPPQGSPGGCDGWRRDSQLFITLIPISCAINFPPPSPALWMAESKSEAAVNGLRVGNLWGVWEGASPKKTPNSFGVNISHLRHETPDWKRTSRGSESFLTL